MTDPVVSEAPTEITIPARAAAIAWLNAFLASSTNEERPALCLMMPMLRPHEKKAAGSE